MNLREKIIELLNFVTPNLINMNFDLIPQKVYMVKEVVVTLQK